MHGRGRLVHGIAVAAAVAAAMIVGCARAQPVPGGDQQESAGAPGASGDALGTAQPVGSSTNPPDADVGPRPARMRTSRLVEPPPKPNPDPGPVRAAEPGPWARLGPSARSGAAGAHPVDGEDSALGLENAGGKPARPGTDADTDMLAADGPARAYQHGDNDPKQPAGQGGGPAVEGSAQGTKHTWNDGDRTLRVRVRTDLVVLPDGEIVPAADYSRSDDDTPGGSSGLPVFSTESGSLMTLPGGVLLMLDPQWDPASVDAFFARNSIDRARVSDLDYASNGFFVETAAGFPSLTLANLLAAQDGVVLSSPNWGTEIVAK